MSLCVSKRQTSICLKPENDVLPFSMCVSLPFNMNSMCAMSKQDEIAVILKKELHSADQMPLLIICVMSKLLLWRYRLDPSLFVWSISEVVPHDRLIIILISWESSAIPFVLSIEISQAILINYKVAISLND